MLEFFPERSFHRADNGGVLPIISLFKLLQPHIAALRPFRMIYPAMVAMVLTNASAEPTACRVMLDSGDSGYSQFDNFRALRWYLRAGDSCGNTYESLMKTTRGYIDAGETANDTSSEALFLQGLYLSDSLQHQYPDSAQSYFLKAIAAANLTMRETGPKRIVLARIIERNIKKSISLDSTFPPAHAVLGAYYREVATTSVFLRAIARLFFGGIPYGTLDDSRRSLQKALALSPRNIFALLQLARTEEAMGLQNEAVARLKSIEKVPESWHLDRRLKMEARELLNKLVAERAGNMLKDAHWYAGIGNRPGYGLMLVIRQCPRPLRVMVASIPALVTYLRSSARVNPRRIEIRPSVKVKPPRYSMPASKVKQT